MQKWILILIIVTLIFSGMGMGSADIEDNWVCRRGDPGRRSYCNKTIHFPYSISWDISMPQAHAVLASNDYFVIIRAGEAIVFHKNSMKELHTINIEGPCIPVIFEDNLVSFQNNALKANKLSNGSQTFQIKMEFGKPAFLIPSKNFLIATTDKGELLKISNNTIENHTTLPDKATVCPVITSDRIVVACDDYNVHMFDFKLTIMATSSTIGTICDMILFDEKSVVVIREKGGSISLNLRDANQIWNNYSPQGRNLHAISDGKRIYLLGGDSGIVCVRPDGRTSWVNRSITPSFGAISGRLLLVTTRDGFLQLIQTATGQAHTPYKTPGNATTTPTILNDCAFLICGPRVLKLSSSQFGTYLGFECDLDFDRLCPEKIYKRPITISNISGKTVYARIYCLVKNASVSETTLKILPGKTLDINLSINTFNIMDFEEKGELIIDTPAFRYRLGVQYDISQIPGDCNLDCIVDTLDMITIATSLGKRSYHKGYKTEYDFDKNGIINELDVKIVIDNFGVSWK